MKLKFSFLLLIFTGIFTISFAQIEPDSIQQFFFKNLHAKYQNNIGISWNKITGSPDIITFSKPVTFHMNQETASKEFLKELNGLFKYRITKDTLVLIDSKENEGIKYFRYQQKYKGIPVKGGEYMVTVLKDGSVQTVLGSFYKDIELETIPKISFDEALSFALKNTSGKIELKDSLDSYSMIIYPKDKFYYLAWELNIQSIKDHGIWNYIIDASTGNILDYNNNFVFENLEILPPPQSEAYVYVRHPGIDA